MGSKSRRLLLLALIGLLARETVFADMAVDCAATDKVTAEHVANTDYTFDDWWHGDRALGDWFGARTTLEDDGVDFFLSTESDTAGNPTGGRSQGLTYVNSIEFGVKLDMQKLVGWQGGSILIRAVDRNGQNLSEKFIGNFFTVQQVFGSEALMLQSIAIEQKLFNDSLSIKAGRVAMGDDFATSPIYGLYMSNSVDGTPKSLTTTNAFSCYPGSVWGGRVRYEDPKKQWNASFGVYQADDRLYIANKHDLDFSIRGQDGVTMIAQVGWTPTFDKTETKAANGEVTVSGLQGHYWMGGYVSLWDIPQFNSTETYDTSYALYWHADQMIYQSEPGTDKGLSVWALFDLAPQQNVSLMPYQVAGGLFYKGLIPSRDHDYVMVGASCGWFSRDYAQEQIAAGQDDPGSEKIFEIGYRVQLNKFFFIQPNLQYIFDPYGTKIPDAVVLGARVALVY